MKVIGYARVSTAEQASDGKSLEEQRERIARWCADGGHELVEVLADEGISGATVAARPALQRALSAIRRRGADALAIVSLSRISRNYGELGRMVDAYFKRAKLVSLSESLDTSTAAGRAQLGMLGVMASWEREVGSERVTAVLRMKRSRGERVSGRAEYGYRLVPSGRAASKRGRAAMDLEPDPAEQLVASKIKALAKSGMSLRAISSTLAEAGTTARCGRPFEPKTIARILERS